MFHKQYKDSFCTVELYQIGSLLISHLRNPSCASEEFFLHVHYW